MNLINWFLELNSKALFTGKICVCVNAKVAIKVMVTQTHMLRMGSERILDI